MQFADDQHGDGEDGQQHGGAEVRLQQREPDRYDGEQQGDDEALPRRPAGAQDGGEHEQQPELGELGRLEGQRTDRDPAGGPVRRRTDREDAGEQDHGSRRRRPRPGRRGSGRGARQNTASATTPPAAIRAWRSARSVAPIRYRLAIPSPTSATAATTASRLNAALRRFLRCSRVGRRPTPEIRRPGGRHVRPPYGGSHPFAPVRWQEPTTTGAEAATAGAAVTAITAAPTTGGSGTTPTASTRSA